MNEMYKRIADLCNSRGITIGKMANDLVIRQGLFSDLKRDENRKLSASYTAQVAQYLNVSTDYLINGTDKKSPSSEEDELKINTIKIAGRDGTFIERTLTDEQIALFKNMLDQLKSIDDENL